MKKIILIVAVVFFLVSLGFVYLNRVVLPQKLKAMIITGIGDTLQRKVSLESVSFNIFKGLVVRGLAVYDENGVILKVKEASSALLIMPFFKKQIILPSLKIKYPVLFLERRQDKTFNVSDMFIRKQPQAAGKSGFAVLIPKVSIIGGKVEFRDNTCTPAFIKQADKFNLIVYLSLPVKVKFKLEFNMPQPAGTGQAAKISASGEYNIAAGSLSSTATVKDLTSYGFDSYYRSFGISLPGGNIDAGLTLNLKGSILNTVLNGQIENLSFSKDKISGRINSKVRADLSYNFSSRKLDYAGNMDVSDAEVSGIGPLGKISGIKGEIKFSPNEISSKNLKASVFGLAVEANAKLSNFYDPLFNLNAVAEAGLDSIMLLLKDNFGFSLPLDVSGRGKISLALTYQSAAGAATSPQISGTADLVNASVKLKDPALSVDSINGPVKFDLNGLAWENVNFKYSGEDYRISGMLVNFKMPGVQLKVSSNDLALKSVFSFANKKLAFSELSGRYRNSEFSILGDVDFAVPQVVRASATARLNIDLKDLKVPLKKFKSQLDKIDPQGTVQIEGRLNGNVKDIRSCFIGAKASAGSLSLYGLKPSGFTMDYLQENGLAEIPLMHIELYDGYAEASGKMNLVSENLPYWINAVIEGVKIEKLKNDTASRDKDIAGTVQARVKINGFSSDLSKLSGAGRIAITDGKLWQLNLFQGIGALLFTSDFTKVVFNEGSCGFVVQDKNIYTDDLRLRSTLAGITGEAKIGFDGSLDAALNAEVSPEAPLSGTVRDITTAILGQASKIGVIRITGTLKEPKFKFKPAVGDIIKSIKDTFFGK